MKNDTFSSDYVIAESDQHEYNSFLQSIKDQFSSIISGSKIPIFTTDAEGLFDLFLNNLPMDVKQQYVCHACRHFVEQYGNFVTINDNGSIQPVMWGDDVPAFFKPSVEAIRNQIMKSNVNGVFISGTAELGKSITGIWHHMAVCLPDSMVSKSRLKSPYQISAEKLEDFNILIKCLEDYSLEAVEQAVILLKTESLYRSEKCLGVAEWFSQLHKKIINLKDGHKRNNIIWLAAATAPTGYCHIRSSMIGTLLDDIVSGLSFDSVSRRFSDKMHPLQYQRPQASPTIGNVMQAEKIIEKLGIQRSFARRFARLEELEKLWVPKEKERKIGKGFFSHLETKEKPKHNNIEIPSITITWKKFLETVLPSAEKIEFLVKSGLDNYSAILTAVYSDAPPIIQWDSEKNRNPFSHYVRVGGSPYSDWNLSTGYCNVTGICYQPSMWHGNFGYQGKSVFFILKGAKDKREIGSGNALFPEILKADLHEIRSTIEAYSKKERIEGYIGASACGIRLQAGLTWDYTFRITSNIGIMTYKLDRWD